jgi:hypothetical protein
VNDLTLTRLQRVALELLQRAHGHPGTDDGIVTAEATFYDSEANIAWVHWKTAQGLERRGKIRLRYDPDGDQIELVAEPAARVAP